MIGSLEAPSFSVVQIAIKKNQLRSWCRSIMQRQDSEAYRRMAEKHLRFASHNTKASDKRLKKPSDHENAQ